MCTVWYAIFRFLNRGDGIIAKTIRAGLVSMAVLAIACSTATVPDPVPTITPVPVTHTPTPEPTATPDPTRSLFRYTHAMALLSNGHYEDAIAQFNIVIRMLPNLASAYYGRGLARFHDEQVGLALEDLGTAIELKPNYADALRNRGMIYLSRNEVSNGIADLSKALKLYEEDGDDKAARAVKTILEAR